MKIDRTGGLLRPRTTFAPFAPPTEATRAPEPIDTVLLIHGTFANKRHPGAADWWLPGSEFCTEIDAQLQAAGAKAKCWAHTDQPFAWTGANSERDRRYAGRALAKQLQALENDPRVRRYHLVSHSHGGNVVLNALGQLLVSPKKLGAVVYLGTPVLSFYHRRPIDPRWISVPLYLLLLGGCLWIFPRINEGRIWLGLVVLALVLVLFAEVARLFRENPRARGDFYGSGKASAFAFGDDEAITALQTAQEITRDPKRFIDQFTRVEEPPPPAIDPTPAPEETLEEKTRKTGAYIFYDALKEPETPMFSGVMQLGNPPGVRSKAAETAVQIAKVIPAGPAVLSFLQLLFGALALIPLLLPLIFTGIFGFVARIFGRIARFFMMVAAKRAARFALPTLVRKAAMGADQGRFVEVRNLPRGVSALEDLGSASAEAARVSKQLASNLGDATMRSIVAMDAFAIKTTVTEALSNTALVHSHYYRSAEVRARIVQLICAASGAPLSQPFVRPEA